MGLGFRWRSDKTNVQSMAEINLYDDEPAYVVNSGNFTNCKKNLLWNQTLCRQFKPNRRASILSAFFLCKVKPMGGHSQKKGPRTRWWLSPTSHFGNVPHPRALPIERHKAKLYYEPKHLYSLKVARTLHHI